ncbi:MAG: rhomboid family intramembrane serine protease, partial [Clostridia bacterium]|nr:rhomboid family intramembrane serine protease [Clostridia bacterium]
TTLFVVVLCIVLHAALGSQWGIETDGYNHWDDVLFFNNLVQTFLSAFSHFNWQHVLLNMLCFLICGIYLERKIGSLYMLLLVLCFAFFGSCAIAANHNSINSYGYSGVNYAFYAYILIDYLFSVCRKSTRNKMNVISGGVMLALIYFAMCFCGGTSTVSFKWYPYDLLHNLGHYTSYLVGLIIGVAIKTI